MGRWEPNARGRLAQAALTLYAVPGFEQTTAAGIARAASLLGETGVAIYRVAFARWVGEPGQPDPAAILRECTAELKTALGDRLPSLA